MAQAQSFTPPYPSCHSWGEYVGVGGYASGANASSGGIGAYAWGFVGGGTAEALQSLTFYVGRTKTLHFNIEILRLGGKITLGAASLANTEKTCYVDYFDEEHYLRWEVDPLLEWDEVVSKILFIVSILSPFAPANIAEAINYISIIGSYYDLFDLLYNAYEMGEAEYIYIQFSYTFDKGYHTIWPGLRATATGCVTGGAYAVTIGQITKIVVDGIAPPSTPVIDGPDKSTTGVTCHFSVSSTDPNNDKIQYKIYWGDGETSSWSEFKKSGESVSFSHTYSEPGTYTIKTIARDIDLMESNLTEHTIHIGRPPKTPKKPDGPTSGERWISYSYSTSTTDPDGDKIQYKFDWGDDTQSKWTSLVDSGSSTSLSHKWISSGTYYVKVKARDEYGGESDWSPPLTVVIDDPPNKPSKPNGTQSGEVGQSYSYETSTIDPDGDPVMYEFDWGDGTTTDTEYYPSGEIISVIHSWSQERGYLVKVRAYDGLKWSEWSDPLPVVIGEINLQVISPNGGEKWFRGETHEIKWTWDGNLSKKVSILLCRGSKIVNVIAVSTENDGSYFWKIPSDIEKGDDYSVLIMASFYGITIGDKSDDVFSIIRPTGTITVISPNGGEKWEKGVYHNITWKISGEIGDVEILLWKEDNENEPVEIISESVDSENCSFSWYTSPDLEPGRYAVAVVTVDESIGDSSDDWFEITPGTDELPRRPRNPSGPTTGYGYVKYRYSTATTDPQEMDIKYYFDWGDGTGEWTGWMQSGEEVTLSHSWNTTSTKTYYVKVKAKNKYGESPWSDPLKVKIIGNSPPDKPHIEGPSKIKIGEKIIFRISSTDLDEDNIYYYIKFGDGSYRDWFGPFESGETINISHTWDDEGDYQIKIKAKDIHGAESEWSTKKVSVPLMKKIVTNKIFNLLKFSILKRASKLFLKSYGGV
jgi:hypothetical protein